MKNYKYFTGFILVLLLVHCQKTELPADPGVANLISPVDKETCLDGASINDTQSNVTFEWSTATGALSYELEIANLLTQSTQIYSSDTNELSIALSKAEPYSWLVRSIGETGTAPSVSDPWKFYLAGDAVVNYAPFPAELITPRSGANTTPDINNLVILRWAADDVDDNLNRFEVYLDAIDGTTLNQEIAYLAQETQLEVDVENNTVYYWKIVAIDLNGNQSSSGVYTFRTN
jgi:hypothetical protein